MKITELATNGLVREYKVTVPHSDFAKKIDARLVEIGKTLKLPGFRPGKVPMATLKARYSGAVMGEVIEKLVDETANDTFRQKNVRPALQPKIELASAGEGKDLEYTITVEILPEIEPADLKSIKLERLTAEVDAEKIDEAMNRLAAATRQTIEVIEARAAAKGDQVTIDFDGSVDGEKKPGMAAEGYKLELGSNSMIPGFEDGIVGLKKGESKTITVTFPADYGAADLAGKVAKFEITLHKIESFVPAVIDDALAEKFGKANLAELRDAIKESIAADFKKAGRSRIKRSLLDALADSHDFAVPHGMVDIEFKAIWSGVEAAQKNGTLDAEDLGKDDETLKAEYTAIAERRVRLGLLLTEIGNRNNIVVTSQEINRAVSAEASRWPGQEKQVFDFYRNNPRALDSIRAPLYEDKVVDFILELVNVTEKTVSVEELMADPDTVESSTSSAAVKKTSAKAKKAVKADDTAEDAEKPAKVTKAKKTEAKTEAEAPEEAEKPKKASKSKSAA